jgi:hypothetical protein
MAKVYADLIYMVMPSVGGALGGKFVTPEDANQVGGFNLHLGWSLGELIIT